MTIEEKVVNHRARRHGTSNYGISRTIRVMLDLLTVKFLISYSTRPLHIFGLLGFIMGLLGAAVCAWMVWVKFYEVESIGNRPLLLFGILLVFTGVQLVTLGLLAEMQARTYHESQNKPIYVIREGVLQDLRYTFRTLRRDAGFTAFAILIVGLGIGASSTVFSVANALLIRRLPFRDPGRLVWITNRDSSGLSGRTTQVSNLLDLREQNQSFSDLAAYFAFYGVGDSKLTGQGEPERLSGVPVSQNFFPLLGVQPELGRGFSADECKWNGPKAVLLSHSVCGSGASPPIPASSAAPSDAER